MNKAERLFNLVTLLRARRTAITAEAIADVMEVSVRTVYRDIQALILSGIPIDGEPGVGYILRPGSHLPPLMFDREEVMALIAGIRMVKAFTDPELAQAAIQAESKIRSVLTDELKIEAGRQPYYIPVLNRDQYLRELHQAIRVACDQKKKVELRYSDAEGNLTERVLWPLGILGLFGRWLLVAYCELRQDYRAFRLDRIQQCEVLNDSFQTCPEINMEHYIKIQIGEIKSTQRQDKAI